MEEMTGMHATPERLSVAGLVALILLAQAPCAAGTTEDARATALAVAGAVVSVELVVEVKMSYEGQTEKEQQKISANATVIDPSGLAVTALSEIDPSGFSQFVEESEGFTYSVDVADLKLRLEDGTEMPADVVGRDQDLNLAFIRPKKAPDTAMRFVDLSKSGSPQILDELVVVSRLGKAGNQASAATIERVQAVVSKPRTFYVIYNLGNRGCPALTLDGRAVGITVARMAKGTGSGRDPYSDYEELDVVMPAAAVLQAAAQVAGAAG